MLEHVHVLLDELVASNSGEGESLVVELPGVDVDLGILTLLEELSLDVLSVGPVSGVESSGEHVDLVVELFLGLIKVDAGSVELNEIDDAIILHCVLEGVESGEGGRGAEESEHGKLHYRRQKGMVSMLEWQEVINGVELTFYKLLYYSNGIVRCR